jgi:formate hydrogenlyase transcriptional activator
VETGAFRRDLYYRLNVFPIHVPPLRDRVEDIPLLVEYLTERFASKTGKKIRSIKKATLELFQTYDWPGNIRELQNVIERAVILCDGDTLTVDETWLKRETPRPSSFAHGLGRWDVDEEKQAIKIALKECGGRVLKRPPPARASGYQLLSRTLVTLLQYGAGGSTGNQFSSASIGSADRRAHS